MRPANWTNWTPSEGCAREPTEAQPKPFEAGEETRAQRGDKMTAVAAIKVSDSALESDQVSRSIPTTKHCNNSAPRHKQPDEEESSEGGRVLTDVSSSGASSDADASNVAGDGKLDECCANDDDDDDGDRDNISDDQVSSVMEKRRRRATAKLCCRLSRGWV